MTVGKKILLVLSPILTMILDIHQLLISLAILVTIDLITGIIKTIKLKKIKINLLNKSFWMAVNSSGFRKTWIKAYQYCIGMIAFIILDSMILNGKDIMIPVIGKHSLAQIAGIYLCLTEFWSIFENMESISGNNPLKKILGIMPSHVASVFRGNSNKNNKM